MTSSQTPERWPDFLVIGAPKAGTTAFFKALAKHPQVFASDEKEPRFFAYPGSKPSFQGPGGEKVANSIVHQEKDYLDLFRGCPVGLISGEASTAYLHHENAPANAHAKAPSARIIAVLRHPVSRGYSQWLHLRQEGREDISDYETAWNSEQIRKAKGWPTMWFYRERGFYAEQLDRWLTYYSREQVLILFYEDWLQRPTETLSKVCNHLEISDFERPQVTRENVSSRQPRWKWLHYRMVEENRLRKLAQSYLPLWVRNGITSSITSVNLRQGPSLDPALRARLAVTYHDDIERLEALTRRDLTHWKT